jgi:hypothetical protein
MMALLSHILQVPCFVIYHAFLFAKDIRASHVIGHRRQFIDERDWRDV